MYRHFCRTRIFIYLFRYDDDLISWFLDLDYDDSNSVDEPRSIVEATASDFPEVTM